MATEYVIALQKALCSVYRTGAPANMAVPMALVPRMDSAHAVRQKWGTTSVTERANILWNMSDIMEENLQLLAIADTIDNGKPLRDYIDIGRGEGAECLVITACGSSKRKSLGLWQRS